MKYQEDNLCMYDDLGPVLKKIISKLLAGNLVVEDQEIEIPDDCELDVKVKFRSDEDGGSVTIKISWDCFVECEEKEEEEKKCKCREEDF